MSRICVYFLLTMYCWINADTVNMGIFVTGVGLAGTSILMKRTGYLKLKLSSVRASRWAAVQITSLCCSLLFYIGQMAFFIFFTTSAPARIVSARRHLGRNVLLISENRYDTVKEAHDPSGKEQYTSRNREVSTHLVFRSLPCSHAFRGSHGCEVCIVRPCRSRIPRQSLFSVLRPLSHRP